MPNGDVFLQELKRWQEHASYWQTEASARQANFQKAVELTSSGTIAKELGYLANLQLRPGGRPAALVSLIGGKQGHPAGATGLQVMARGYREITGMRPEQLEQLTRAYQRHGTLTPAEELGLAEIATKKFAESNWLVWFYGVAPELVKFGMVTSFEDIAAMQDTSILSPGAIDIARKAVDQMKQNIVPTTETGVPSWAGITPEQEAAVAEFVAGAVTKPVPMRTINTMTVEEIAKALRIIPTAAAEMPYSEEETLRIMSLMGYTVDEVAEASNFSSAVAEYNKAIAAQQQQISEVLAGLADWKTPKLSIWSNFKLLALSPFQFLGDVMQPYIENVTYPLAGMAVMSFQRLWPDYQGLQQSYDEIRASGQNFWSASGQAWDKWGAPWFLKLPVEIIIDPLTWIPGWGLSKPASLAKRVGLIKVGAALTSVNKGMYAALDVPFDLGKSALRHIPRSFSQEITHEVNQTMTHIWAAADIVAPGARTAEAFEKTINTSLDTFITNPAGKDTLSNLGRELSEFAPMSSEQLQMWSNKLGGTLTAETSKLPSINQGIRDAMAAMVNKTIPAEAAAKIIAGTLGVADSPTAIKQIVKDTSAYLKQFIRGAQDAVRVAKTSLIAPFAEGMQVIKNSRTKVIKAIQASRTADGDFLTGVVLGLQRYTEAWTRGRWQRTIERYLIKPMAEANLGSMSYPIWNAFEGIAVTLLEGITPGMAKVSVARSLWHRLTLDNTIRNTIEEIERRASDVAQITGLGKANSLSFIRVVIPEEFSIFGKALNTPKWLAGKDYLQWVTGAKYLDFSNFLGNHLRVNFITKKMAQHLAELASDVGGKDVTAAIKRLIKGKSPYTSNSRLGMTREVLEDEAWYRMLTGDREFLLALPNDLSSGSLMISEQMKLLRKCDLFSPRARALAEQDIAAGKVLQSDESINAFARKGASESIADLHARPQALPEAFADVANQVELTEIKTADDLMNIYQIYYATSLDAYNLPSVMMSRTFEESAILRKAGKFQQIDRLWRTKREEMTTIVDGVNSSLERIKSKITANSGKLTTEQSDAMLQILDFMSARNSLRESTLQADKNILDTFWSQPRAQRDYEQFWSDRQVIWANYRKESSVFAGQDFLQGESFARLYNKLPAERLTPVDAASRALSQDDVAKVLGCNVDNLTQGLMDNTVRTQFKEDFVQIILQKANSRPTLFKGFTEEKIGKVYDDILEGIKMQPGIGIDEQKILHQAEALRQDLINLKLTGTVTPAEQEAIKNWVNQLAEGMDDIFGEKLYTTDVGLFEHIATETEIADFEAMVRGTMKLNPGMSEEAARLEVFGTEKIPVVADYEALNTLKDRLTKLGESVKVPEGTASLDELIRRWFDWSDNDALQTICRSARQDKSYLNQVHAILKKQYPSGYIRIYRGSGAAGKEALDREFVNVTSSRRVAKEFEDNWTATPQGLGKRVTPEAPSVDNIVIKVDDVVSIGSVEESELFIPSAVLRDRINTPLVPPVKVTRAEWQGIREEANSLAHQDYYKAFADYTNQNLLDAMMRTVYPYWTYHQYRWFFLPRTFIRHPGVAAAWGKYQNYSDYGYVHLPGSNLDLNPFVGSVMGATFGLARHDYKSYFENLGMVGEALDLSQRYGFFPNAWYTGLVTFTPVASGRPPEFGEILPPFARFGLNLFRGSNIPGVKDAADWLQSKIFHDNFRDYYIATEVSAMQVEASGTLIGGQSGVDLWNKLRDKLKLTDEEQAIWDEATLRASWYGVLRTQFPQFRLREEEYLDAYQQVTQIFEQQLGMSEEYQDNLWKHNLRPTDVVGGLPLDLRMSLDQMWQWRIWFGRGQILMPPEISDLYAKMNKYWDKVKSYQTDRLGKQGDVDSGFISPTKELHYTGREWRDQYSINWSDYTSKVDAVATDPEFAGAIDAMTPEGQVKLAKRLGFAVPPLSAWDEAIDLYFSIELEKAKDPYTGEEDYDYLGFWLNREAVRQALTEEQRADFDTYIRRYETPMERLFRDISNRYLRGYRAVSRILLESYTEEQKALIKEFYADTTTSARKEELRDITGPGGFKLISGWEGALSDARIRMRQASPTLDFWLYVFGYTTKPRTSAAQTMVDTWEQNKSSILENYKISQ